jgi:hypothetical protein
VSPEEFDEAFRRAEKSFKARIASTYLYTRDWTDLVLGCSDDEQCVLAETARRLKLEYCREYYRLDAVMYEKLDSSHFDTDYWLAAEQLAVVIEHENHAGGANREMNKLTIYNSPLKVLFIYPSSSGSVTAAEACLGRYAEIARRADIFSDFTTLRRHLVILGSAADDDSMEWNSYVYKLGEFVPLRSGQ